MSSRLVLLVLAATLAAPVVVQAGKGTYIPPPGLDPSQVNNPRLALIDTAYYLSRNSDVKRVYESASVAQIQRHWLDNGIKEGREASPNFSIGGYRARYPDLARAFGNDYVALVQHWIVSGQREGRDPRAAGTYMADPRAANLDPKFYVTYYPDLAAAFGGLRVPALVEHWLVFGEKECRQPSATTPPTSGPNSQALDMNCSFLKVNQTLVSSNRSWFAILQGDGNFCVYPGSGIESLNSASGNGTKKCISNTSYGAGPFFATIQGDGNFCVYRGTDPAHGSGAVWCSMVVKGAGQYAAFIQNDGNFAIYKGAPSAQTYVWSLGLPGPAERGSYSWSDFTTDLKGAHCAMHPEDMTLCGG